MYIDIQAVVKDVDGCSDAADTIVGLGEELSGGSTEFVVVAFVGGGAYIGTVTEEQTEADIDVYAQLDAYRDSDVYAFTDELHREIEDEVVSIDHKRYLAYEME